MQKKILITGSTDGIGAAAAKALVAMGNHILLHGRSQEKLKATVAELSAIPGPGSVEHTLPIYQ